MIYDESCKEKAKLTIIASLYDHVGTGSIDSVASISCTVISIIALNNISNKYISQRMNKEINKTSLEKMTGCNDDVVYLLQESDSIGYQSKCLKYRDLHRRIPMNHNSSQ